MKLEINKKKEICIKEHIDVDVNNCYLKGKYETGTVMWFGAYKGNENMYKVTVDDYSRVNVEKYSKDFPMKCFIKSFMECHIDTEVITKDEFVSVLKETIDPIRFLENGILAGA